MGNRGESYWNPDGAPVRLGVTRVPDGAHRKGFTKQGGNKGLPKRSNRKVNKKGSAKMFTTNVHKNSCTRKGYQKNVNKLWSTKKTKNINKKGYQKVDN